VGYQTTAYFLDWIEERSGRGAIRALNKALKDEEYDEKIFVVIGAEPVRDLWRRFKAELGVEDRESEEEEEEKEGGGGGGEALV
jgi:hypothetical protein